MSRAAAGRHALPEAGPGPLPVAGPVPGPAAGTLEHSLKSLLQLGQELTVSVGLFEVADLLLFNLMGHFATPRSALWLLGAGAQDEPVLVRCRGFGKQQAEAVGFACGKALQARFAGRRDPVRATDLDQDVGDLGFEILRQARVAVVAPVLARDELLGWIALGDRLSRDSYTEADLAILQSSLGLAGAPIQNAQLYSRILETNRQLRVANDRLGELDRLKSEFISNLNHELRTPLATLMVALQFLSGAAADPAATRGLVQSALRSAEHLKRLVENLLTFSDLLKNQLPINPGTHDLGATVSDWHAARLPGVTAGLREFTCNVAPGLPMARYDPNRLVQILDELVENAVKFTPRGCRLHLDLGHEARPDAAWLRLELSDDGPGIPPEKMTSLFNAFEQGDGSMTREASGLGVGLAFCRHLAERMDGRLEASSAPGKGSSFTLLVPEAAP